jgi:hypothetical protein
MAADDDCVTFATTSSLQLTPASVQLATPARTQENACFVYLPVRAALKFVLASKPNTPATLKGRGACIGQMCTYLSQLIKSKSTLVNTQPQTAMPPKIHAATFVTVKPLCKATHIRSTAQASDAATVDKHDMKFIIQMATAADIVELMAWLSKFSPEHKPEPYVMQMMNGVIGPIHPNMHPTEVLEYFNRAAPGVQFTQTTHTGDHCSSKLFWKCTAAQLLLVDQLAGRCLSSSQHPLHVRIRQSPKVTGCSRCLSTAHTYNSCKSNTPACSKCQQSDHESKACTNKPKKLACNFCASKDHRSAKCHDIRPSYQLLNHNIQSCPSTCSTASDSSTTKTGMSSPISSVSTQGWAKVVQRGTQAPAVPPKTTSKQTAPLTSVLDLSLIATTISDSMAPLIHQMTEMMKQQQIFMQQQHAMYSQMHTMVMQLLGHASTLTAPMPQPVPVPQPMPLPIQPMEARTRSDAAAPTHVHPTPMTEEQPKRTKHSRDYPTPIHCALSQKQLSENADESAVPAIRPRPSVPGDISPPLAETGDVLPRK